MRLADRTAVRMTFRRSTARQAECSRTLVAFLAVLALASGAAAAPAHRIAGQMMKCTACSPAFQATAQARPSTAVNSSMATDGGPAAAATRRRSRQTSHSTMPAMRYPCW